jgi:MGT family glycosyltransferase
MIEAGGNVPPQLGVARELALRGHHVHVLGDRTIEAAALAAGCAYLPFRLAPPQNMRDEAADVVRDWEPGGYERLMDRVFFGPAEQYARDVLEQVARVEPETIAVDNLLLGALVGAEKSGVPTVLMMHTICTLPLDGVPPVGLGLRPASGVLGRVRDQLLRRQGRVALDRGLPSLNGARRALGLAPLAHASDQYARVDRALVLTCQAFDLPARSLPHYVRYVGPQLDDPNWVEAWTSPWPDDHPDPLVLVALGTTYQNQRATVARVVDALSGLPVRGLVTLGAVFAPSDFAAAANVVVARSAPHQAVLPKTRAIVTHGGHGTVMKALAHGVPLVCMPLGRDQNDIAVRVEIAGAGIAIKQAADVDAIRHAVRRVLGEPSFLAAARRLAKIIAEDVEAKAAVTELEALALRRAHPFAREEVT